jgi:inosine-uridine nucleoside N-ribohydrolase
MLQRCSVWFLLKFCCHQSFAFGCPFFSFLLCFLSVSLIFAEELHWVRVETSNGFCRGVCIADFRNSKENPVDLPKTVTLLRKADSEKVLQFYSDQIAMLDQKLYSHGR